MPSDKDSLLEMICKNGHVDLLKQLREGKVVQDTNTFATKSDGQNCLHLATGRNRKDMVQYLLKENPKLANMPDKTKNETPLFYALSKHKSASDRLSLVSVFLQHSTALNLNHLNADKKTVYEAYASDDV